MKLIDVSLKNGTGVTVGIVLTGLFGYLAFSRIPIQLNPTIESPYITVETLYPGASAVEVEQEITQRMEEKLAAVEDLREMRSVSQEGLSQITLKYDWGIDKSKAQIDVLQKLNLVENIPEDAEEPQILTVNRREQATIMWVYVHSDTVPVNEVRQVVDDIIVPMISRVPDVANIRRSGGAEKEIHVLVDLASIAARDLTLGEIANSLSRENRNVRGGKIDKGSTRLVVRTLGQYQNLDQIRQTVVKDTPSGPVKIADIAEVQEGNEDPEAVVRVNGTPSIALGVIQQTGANTLSVAEEVKAMIARLNAALAPRDVQIGMSYDSSQYIWSAIYQLRDNLILGSFLATAVLWIFLRSIASTVIVGITIPICMVGTFVLLIAFGRSVNVVSLAGLAFASGMIVDNGIVVVENIYRHRTELGKSILHSARDGTIEVWAPIVASTLTTLAVFIPILFIQERAGQLFRDIAYAITFAVGLSMLAAITVVPMLASRWLEGLPLKEGTVPRAPGSERKHWHFPPALWLHKKVDPTFSFLGGLVANTFYGTVRLGMKSMAFRVVVITVIVGMFFASLSLIPPAEYLPRGNENFILGMLKLPAGMSLEGSLDLMLEMENMVLSTPEVERTFFVVFRDMPLFGAILKPELATKENIQRLIGTWTAYGSTKYPFPDVIPIIFQVPVFNRASSGKSLTIDISGPDLNQIQSIGDRITQRVRGIPGVMMVRPTLDLYNPELQVLPNRDRLSDLGMTASDVAEVVETLIEGKTTSLYRDGGNEYDLVLKALEGQILQPADLGSVLLSTPGGQKVKLADLALVERRLGPVTVEHLEQERSASLEVTVRDDYPLEKVVEDVNEQVVYPLQADLPIEYLIGLSGEADDLVNTIKALSTSFILALIIVYLLMAALFRSFIYPAIIMFSVPLAMTGAFVAIALTGAEYNVITMLGFILLAGVVVNNAILLVQVTLSLVREGMDHAEAVVEGVRLRIRPIFMTSVTSVLGMLPMATGKGAGSDLYSGLGVAVIGGLTLSTLFTLVLIPLLLKSLMRVRDAIAWLLGREDLTEVGISRKLAQLDSEF